MHYILIDDNQEALAFLALQMGKAFPGELALTRLTLIWPNNIPIESTLRNAASSLETGSADFHLHTPQTLKQLIAFIENVAKDQEPAVLVSDLNMKNIGLTADGEDGWFDRNSELRRVIQLFLGPPSRSMFVHSARLNRDEVAGSLDPHGIRAIALRGSFDNNPTPAQAKLIAEELLSIVGKTRLEKLWSNHDAASWFSNGKVPHDWSDNWTKAQGFPPNYKKCISDVLAVGEIPDFGWTESFHESLKGLVGANFCGSPKYGEVPRDEPLRLGAVAILALLAHHATTDSASKFFSLFKVLPPEVAKRPFLHSTDEAETQEAALALWWMFVKCFEREEKHENKTLTSLDVLPDGFRLEFEWNPGKLFAEARAIARTDAQHSNATEAPSKRRIKPSNSRHALASAITKLMFHPGQILASDESICVQSVITP